MSAGYISLKGNGGVDIPIGQTTDGREQASGELIDQSFRKIYRQACAHASRE